MHLPGSYRTAACTLALETHVRGGACNNNPVQSITSRSILNMTPHPQQIALEHSLRDPEGFWSGPAERLHWHRKPSRALTLQSKTLPSGVKHEHWSWFADGEISTTYNCVDRHVHSGLGDQVAIIWESPVTKTTEKFTYKQLLDEVEVLAGMLREEGVRKGDVVIIYST